MSVFLFGRWPESVFGVGLQGAFQNDSISSLVCREWFRVLQEYFDSE